jgi:uncharacterized protein (TIGR02147 family)
MVVMTNIFEFRNYRDYIQALCNSQRGYLTVLADAAGCAKSYLSSCLKEKCHLTLDHIYGIAEYLQMNDQEEEYFFLLLEKDKCSTLKLRKKLETKLKELSREAFRLKNQQSSSLIVQDNNHSSGLGQYYSVSTYIAIHSLTAIDRYQTLDKMAERLLLPKAVVQYYLDELIKMDLVKKDGVRYKWNTFSIHLADDSAWITTHHSNWRVSAMQNLQKRDHTALHYSLVQSISEADFEVLKKKMSQFIKEFAKVATPSASEESYNFNIDFYKI